MTRRILRFFVNALFGFIAIQGTASYAAEAIEVSPEKVVLGTGASVSERILSMPGDPDRPARLVVTVLTPDGPGPFPLAIMNHGAAGSTRTDLEPRYWNTLSAYYFLSRGYAVALPMMRGYAGSEGKEIYSGCSQEELGLDNAKDIRAVIEHMSAQPYIEGKQVIVAGQSFGGWNTLALGTLNDPRVKGMIVFAGSINISSCGDTQSTLASSAHDYESQTSIPSIWFYGDNDKRFPAPVWHAMYDRYTAAGGKAELVAYGKFMNDSHNLLGFPESTKIWVPKVDNFLAKLEMPYKNLHPEYMPVEFPPPTDFAAIDNVDVIPYIGDKGREDYKKFLSDPMPKVFLISPTGMAARFNGGADPLGRALAACRKASQECMVYAADNDVTWVKQMPIPPATNFAALDDVNAVPYLNDKGRQNYQAFLKKKNPRAFAITPNGAAVSTQGGYDPLARALNICKNHGMDCRPYAVNDQVVWMENKKVAAH